MKRTIVLVAAMLVAVIAASPASAAKPSREHLDISDDTFPGNCSFTVARHVLVNKSVLTTYSNGNQRITGTFKQRISNLDTGKFIDVTSSGPVFIEYHADGSSTEKDFGRQFERPPGQLLLTTGPVAWEFDSGGNVVSYRQLGGTTQDVCALLA